MMTDLAVYKSLTIKDNNEITLSPMLRARLDHLVLSTTTDKVLCVYNFQDGDYVGQRSWRRIEFGFRNYNIQFIIILF